MVQLKGSCHCHAITFAVQASDHLTVYRCNCSICTLKQNHHFIVPQSHFTLLTGEDQLTEYRFNTQTAKHLFCRVCGVECFYVPRSNPDGYAITLYCIEGFQSIHVEWKEFDGINWEVCYAESDISKHSKLD